jgi:hypothetical protein
MTREEVGTLLAYIAAALPAVQVAPETVRVWHDLLGDLPRDVAFAAVRRVLMTQRGSWLPAPGEIRAAAVALQSAPVPSADAAWGQVMAAVRQWGYYEPARALAALDPPVRAVAEAIGWDALCQGDPDVVRGQFVRLYAEAVAQAQAVAPLPPALQDGRLAAPAGRAPEAVGAVLQRLLPPREAAP